LHAEQQVFGLWAQPIECCGRVVIDFSPASGDLLQARDASKEGVMRSNLSTVTAMAGLVLICLTTSPASSITITTPAGVLQGIDSLELSEAVHCRRYPHRHRHGHRWSRGCRVGTDIVTPRRAHRGRSVTTLPGARPPSPVGRLPSNFINPNNPQDRSGGSNRQDMSRPRAINPQDMR
jgi:hypothetical protein